MQHLQEPVAALKELLATLALVRSQFVVQGIAMSRVSLGMTKYPPSGRGRGHLTSNF